MHEITTHEVDNVVNFFTSNNLVNNTEKDAILYNSSGRGDLIKIEDIGGKSIQSTYSEKLLGLHINSNFEWSTHIDKISIELKQRIGLLRRIRKRIPRNKHNIHTYCILTIIRHSRIEDSLTGSRTSLLQLGVLNRARD